MSVPNLDETKLEVVINAAMQFLLDVAPHGYTFDSIEVVPYAGFYDVIAYKLWVRNVSGEKVLGKQDIISISICHGEKAQKKEEAVNG